MGGGELSGKPDKMLRGNPVMAFNSGGSSNILHATSCPYSGPVAEWARPLPHPKTGVVKHYS